MRKIKTTQQVIEELNQNKYLTLDVSTYRNTKTKARFIDIEFGEYWCRPSRILEGGCHPLRSKVGSYPLSIEEIKKRLLLRSDGVTIDEKTYKNATTKAKFVDPEFGEWWAEPRTVIGKDQKYSHPSRAQINRNYKKTKYKDRDLFKLSVKLRSRLSRAVRKKYKSGSAVRDLGCTIEELKIHLESKFQTGMTWENYGNKGWHIDHIKPLSSFDLSDPVQLKQACHYTNLQPLWAKDNLSKGDKII